ncbi:hypothetical protein EDD16DRAFT_1527593 [Pisolithus croceorrhizus]|nr:hypothetical protein EDD16DRAFT_1527593 [Pisolithus croceorrhizus]
MADSMEFIYSPWTGQLRKWLLPVKLMGWPVHNMDQRDKGGCHNVWTGQSAIWSEMAQLMDGPVQQMRKDNSCTGHSTIWSEMEWLMEEPVQQHSSWKGQAACKEGCHNTWAGPSIVKYQMYNSCTGPAMIWSETAQLMEGPLWQPSHDVESDGATHGGASVAVKHQTVQLMHWPGHDMESDGATHGVASVAVKHQTIELILWPGHDGESDGAAHGGASAAVKHQTVQLMHWPGHDMESDGATHGVASVAVKHQTIELILWPGHDGESDGAAHGGASAAAVIWSETVQLMEWPVRHVRMDGTTHGVACPYCPVMTWSEREIFYLSLISLSSSSFPVTSQISSASPQIMGGPVQKLMEGPVWQVGADGRAHGLVCPWQTIRRYNSCTGAAMIWSEREIFCLSLISLSSSSCPGTSPSCIGILTIDGGASVAVPTGWRMQLTDKIADYMKSCFREEVLTGQHALPDISIPLLLTKETAESLQYPEIMVLTVIVDGSSNVKLWYLPGTLDGGHQRQIWNSLSRMVVPLKDSINPSGMGRWWKDKALFQEIVDLKGSIDLSPGWYQQGRGVRDSSFHNLCVGDMGQPPNFHPEVSRLLKSGREQNRTWEWVDEMSEFHVLLSGTLMVIHPHMYASGREVLIRLGADAQQRGDTDMSSILPIWNLVYNSISIMANCTTPYHRDVNGQQQWLDMLIMVGHYVPLDFIIPILNLWFRYNPGTIIAMPGSVLEHGDVLVMILELLYGTVHLDIS